MKLEKGRFPVYNVGAMKDFVGNAATVKYLEQAVSGDNLAHAYLFCGPGNVGKTKTGIYFAKMLLCEGENPASCTECPSCKLFASGNHPDFFHFDQETVLVDDIRGLVGSLELRSYRGKGKVALISHAERLTTAALNAFLKTLEEPTSETTIILTTENKKNLLPTIVSRARIVNFGIAESKQIFELLNGELGVKKDEATKIARLASGRAGVAVSLAQDSEKAGAIQGLVDDFNRIYRSPDVYEKISYADKLSKDKDNLINNLQYLELAAREDFLASNDAAKKLIYIKMLDQIAKSREMIGANANAKLVMEGLLLGSVL